MPCAKRAGAATRESHRRDRPGRLTSPAFHACGSASPSRACCRHSSRNQVVSAPYCTMHSLHIPSTRSASCGGKWVPGIITRIAGTKREPSFLLVPKMVGTLLKRPCCISVSGVSVVRTIKAQLWSAQVQAKPQDHPRTEKCMLLVSEMSYMYHQVPKFSPYGSVCYACAQRPGLPRQSFLRTLTSQKT